MPGAAGSGYPPVDYDSFRFPTGLWRRLTEIVSKVDLYGGAARSGHLPGAHLSFETSSVSLLRNPGGTPQPTRDRSQQWAGGAVSVSTAGRVAPPSCSSTRAPAPAARRTFFFAPALRDRAPSRATPSAPDVFSTTRPNLAGFVPVAPLRSVDTAEATGFDLGSAEAGRTAGAVAGRVPWREPVGICKDVVALTRVKPLARVEPGMSHPSALAPFAAGCATAGSSAGAPQVLVKRVDSSTLSLTPLPLPSVALPFPPCSAPPFEFQNSEAIRF